MDRSNRKPLAALLVCLVLLLTAGCSTWGGKVTDVVPGIVPSGERIQTIRKLSEAGLKGDEKLREQIAGELAAQYPRESDPNLRVEMVLAVGKFPSVGGLTMLRQAAKDVSPDVRLATCHGLSHYHSSECIATLRDLVTRDASGDVRQAAIRALGETHDQGAVAILGPLLEDRDPTIQYLAVNSLRQVSPQDLGPDVERWQQYVKSGTVPPAKSVSFTERVKNLF
jgi:hypothetical protein